VITKPPLAENIATTVIQPSTVWQMPTVVACSP
jgi:hypothetical protein